MHPIERLRLVARSQSAPPELLVRESASALGAFRDDPPGLVAACRRIVDRHPTCAPLWWLCARILCAPEPMAEGAEAVAEMDADPTARLLAAEIQEGASVVIVGWPGQSAAALLRRGDLSVSLVDVDGEATEAGGQLLGMDVNAQAVKARNTATAVDHADQVIVEALAVGPGQAIVPSGSRSAALFAADRGVPVWLVAGVGRMLPTRMFEASASRWDLAVDPEHAPEEILDLDRVDLVACRNGLLSTVDALALTDCPVAAELFRPST